MAGVADQATAVVAVLGEQLEKAEGDLPVSAGDEDFHGTAVPAIWGARLAMTTALELLAAFVLSIGGAIGFTNAVEWLGQRMNLGAGAVGALLAAVGTALPESVIPIVALLGGGEHEATDIAIGAIIGAPFLLGTLAMLLVVGAAHVYAGRREQGTDITGEPASTRRDLHWYLSLMPVGIVLGVISPPGAVRYAGAALLVLAYAGYVRATVKSGGDADDDEELDALYFDTSKDDPPSTSEMTAQFVVSLAAIIGGAELFVGAVETIAESARHLHRWCSRSSWRRWPPRCPKKANSVLWVRRGKDALALGIAALFLGQIREQQRQFHVFERREHGDQVVELKDEADVTSAPRGQRALRQGADFRIADADRAARRPIDAGEEVQQCGLARAGRAHQSQEVALGDGDRDAIEHRDFDRVAFVGFRHVPQFDERHPQLPFTRTIPRSVSPAGGFNTTTSPGTTPLLIST